MCDCYEEETEREPLVVLTPVMIDRMRRIEGSLNGDRVPEGAWSVFLGLASGGMAFAHVERLATCRRMVVDLERRRQRSMLGAHRRRTAALSCAAPG